MADLVTIARATLHPQLATAGSDLLAALITAASAAVEAWCNREFTSGEREETYDGDGTNVLWLRQIPVTEVASIVELDEGDTETEITSGSRVNGRTGKLVLLEEYFPAGHQNIVVTYTAGFSTIPGAVQEAVVQLAAKLFSEGLRDATLAREKLGDYEYQVAAVAAGLGSTVAALLAPYRMVRL